MISSQTLKTSPHIILHKITGEISEAESQTGTDEAIACTQYSFEQHGRFHFLLDMRGYSFQTLEARRIWSLGFKTAKPIEDNVNLVAIVGDDNYTVRAEKEMLESETLRFFWDEESAKAWLMKESIC